MYTKASKAIKHFHVQASLSFQTISPFFRQFNILSFNSKTTIRLRYVTCTHQCAQVTTVKRNIFKSKKKKITWHFRREHFFLFGKKKKIIIRSQGHGRRSRRTSCTLWRASDDDALGHGASLVFCLFNSCESSIHQVLLSTYSPCSARLSADIHYGGTMIDGVGLGARARAAGRTRGR